MNSRLTTTVLFLVVIASTAFVTHSISKSEPTTDEVSIDTLLARTDRNLVELKTKIPPVVRTSQDTAAFVNAQRQMLYLSGVRDAFASLREQKTVWLDKEK